MARYKGIIFSGIQPYGEPSDNLIYMSYEWRANFLKSANTQMRYQVMWNGLNENQAPSKANFNASNNKGDIINMVFKVYATTEYPYPVAFENWDLVATIKKTRDIANKSYDTTAPSNETPLTYQRFTIDISQLCQDLLSYSLVPINKGTWQASEWGGMNGGQTKQDNVTETISDYNVSRNGTYRHIFVTAIPEVILANGTIEEVTGQNPLQFNKIAVINSVAQYEQQDIFYNLKYIIQQFTSISSGASRGFMSLCPNFTQTGNIPFLKQVRTDEEAEWLYWYQKSMFNGSTGDFTSTSRLKVETYLSNGTAQNTMYLSDFNSNLLTTTRSNLEVFQKNQNRVCVQNVSPTYINANAKDDAGNALTNQIDSSTSYYKTHLEYINGEDNVSPNTTFDGNITGFESYSSGTASYSTAQTFANFTGSLKSINDGTGEWFFRSTNNLAGITATTTYTATCMVYIDSGYAGGDVYLTGGGSFSGATETTVRADKDLTGVWQKTTTTITTASDTSGRIYGRCASPDPSSGNFVFFSNIVIQANISTIRATEYRYFGIDRETANIPYGFVRFHWLNRIGGVDSYTAKRNITQGLSINRDTIETKSADRTWYQDDQLFNGASVNTDNYISNTMRGGNLYKGGREVLNVKAQRNNSVYTEPLNKQTADWLEEIMTSPNVWVEMDTEATARGNTVNPFQRPSTKEYIPVIITNSDVETLNQETGLVKFNIEYTLAHKVQTQRN